MSNEAAPTSEAVLAHEAAMDLDAAAAHDEVHRMLPYMRLNTPLEQLETFAKSYNSLCHFYYYRGPAAFEFSPVLALPCILELLDVRNQSILRLFCCAIKNLINRKNEDNIEAVQAVPGLTARLVALLGHGSVYVQEDALLTMECLLDGTDSQRERCLDAGCLDHIVRLLQSDNPALVQGAGRVTCRILQSSQSQIQQALQKDILSLLTNILANNELRCQIPAARAICLISKVGSAAQRDQLVSSGVLQPFLACLQQPCTVAAFFVVTGLRHLLTAAQKGDMNTEALRSQLKDIGILDQLKTYSENDFVLTQNTGHGLLEKLSEFLN